MEFLELTFSRHDTCKLLCDTSLAFARSSPTRRYTGLLMQGGVHLGSFPSVTRVLENQFLDSL